MRRDFTVIYVPLYLTKFLVQILTEDTCVFYSIYKWENVNERTKNTRWINS